MSLNSYEFKETVIYIAESKSCYLTTANGTGAPLALPVCYELVSFSFFPQCLLLSKCPLIILPVLHRLQCRSRQLLWDNYPVSGHEPSRLQGSNILTYKGLTEARNYLDKLKKKKKKGGCVKKGSSIQDEWIRACDPQPFPNESVLLYSLLKHQMKEH